MSCSLSGIKGLTYFLVANFTFVGFWISISCHLWYNNRGGLKNEKLVRIKILFLSACAFASSNPFWACKKWQNKIQMVNWHISTSRMVYTLGQQCGLIVPEGVVLKMTLFICNSCSSDWHCDHLSKTHLQSQALVVTLFWKTLSLRELYYTINISQKVRS